MHVLIAGLSARAAAASAARAGFRVSAIDAFDDRDRHPAVRGFSLPRDFGVPFSARAAARAARNIECDAAMYLSNLENHPAAVAALAAKRRLLGNPPHVLRRVRDPLLVARTLARRGFDVPAVCADGSLPEGDWLVKPLRSGGGHGVRAGTPGSNIPRGCYAQQRIDGVSWSIVFVAVNGRAVPLGITQQLIGEAAFGADGYRYCGNILTAPHENEIAARATALASAIAEEFGLIGLNGIDFIANGQRVYPIEVNPRWCSSMELVETAHEVDLFRLHVDACVNGVLPGAARADWRRDSTRPAGAFGKAIVFAREDVVIGESREWLDDPAVRDVPHQGETIARGRPVCTVFTHADTAGACHAALVRAAGRIYEALARWNIVLSSGTSHRERSAALHHERGPHDQTGAADQRRQRQP